MPTSDTNTLATLPQSVSSGAPGSASHAASYRPRSTPSVGPQRLAETSLCAHTLCYNKRNKETKQTQQRNKQTTYQPDSYITMPSPPVHQTNAAEPLLLALLLANYTYRYNIKYSYISRENSSQKPPNAPQYPNQHQHTPNNTNTHPRSLLSNPPHVFNRHFGTEILIFNNCSCQLLQQLSSPFFSRHDSFGHLPPI